MVQPLPYSNPLGTNQALLQNIAQAWGYVLPGGSLVGSSGARPGGRPGSQHYSGNAWDYQVLRGDGSVVRWDAPEVSAAAQIFAALTGQNVGVGWGPNYMGGSYFHFDDGMNPHAPRSRVMYWSDDDGTASDTGPGAAQFGQLVANARGLGLEGTLGRLGIEAGVVPAFLPQERDPIMQYADAIAAVESRGSGDYEAIGPPVNGNQAYGRYQVMDFNIGPWTEQHYGRRLTPEEFLANPEAQDAVFAGEFGSYVEQYGNPRDAASVWFSGRPLSGNTRTDGYINVPEYVSRFDEALAQLGSAPATGGFFGGGGSGSGGGRRVSSPPQRGGRSVSNDRDMFAAMLANVGPPPGSFVGGLAPPPRPDTAGVDIEDVFGQPGSAPRQLEQRNQDPTEFASLLEEIGTATTRPRMLMRGII